MNKMRWLWLASFGACVAIIPAEANAEEFGANTPYYEDDAWYDISEWFDGNDYNPTDEAIGRWDNDPPAYDNYGYAEGDVAGSEDDWFYDYYDDGYQNWAIDDEGEEDSFFYTLSC